MRSGTRAPFSALRNKKSGRPKDENDDARKQQLSLSLESVCVQSWGGFEGGDALYNPISLLRSLSLLLLDIIPKRDTHTPRVRPFDDDVLKQHAPKTTGNLGPQRERWFVKICFGSKVPKRHTNSRDTKL